MTTSSCPRLLAAAALLLCSPWLPLTAQAQIASPVNAGQNSGNNAFGSARTTIGTPDFTEGRTVVLVPGVRRQPDGTLLPRPDKLVALRNSLRAWVATPEGIRLSAIITDRSPSAELRLSLRNPLILAGVDAATAQSLIDSLAGLVNQSSLNQLNTAINLFNRIAKASGSVGGSKLSSDPLLRAIGNGLSLARNSL